MRAKDIRQSFLNYFARHDHPIVPSSSLIPHNDPTLFFVNAGMVQFKDVFTGLETREVPRATTAQKCLRVSGKHNDLENVGRTPRHHTFFEMLGNFSFGDYFKAQAIPMAWELLTEELGIDADRLWVTVFEEDDEALEIWRDQVGVPAARIQKMGAKDNFWSMGDLGPCGPCSEIHYDHGSAVSDDTRGPAGEGDRYVEIWNLVFMQYEQTASERLVLPRPSIDTGAGLERIAAVKQGVYSNYDTDVFKPLLERASELAGLRYGQDADVDTALRVIADHARASTFLVADGVMPSNEGRGYVLRRVMRRAIRFGVKVGMKTEFLHHVCNSVMDEFAEAYPELPNRRSFVEEVVRGEEERFRRTLDRGMRLLDTELDAAGEGGRVAGDVAFSLSDTFGFPLDLTRLIAEERGVGVDEQGFHQALDAQRARARAAWKGSGEQVTSAVWSTLADEVGETTFGGYAATEGVGTVLAVFASRESGVERVERLESGDSGVVVVDRTPFYAESGGQVGDVGSMTGCQITNTTLEAGLFLHHVRASGGVAVGDAVQLSVDAQKRDATRRNHTGTHLLHAALRKVLGEHVTQKGSLVAPDRLRFDFSHHKPMSGDEVRIIEDEVNAEILRNTGLATELTDREAAVAAGAMALFGEKYADEVRVVRIPGYSVELCGGTHCQATGDIGLFRIVSESGIAAGVRRIEAQTGTGAMAVIREDQNRIQQASQALKTPPDRLVDTIARLQKERRDLEREVQQMKAEAAKAAAGDLLGQAKDVGGVKVLAVAYQGDLREQADRLRDQLGTSVVVLAADRGGKVQLLAAASKDVAGKRVHAGKVIQAIAPLVSGRGGGRPDMAQAGGADPAGISAALDKAVDVVREMLG